jgi:hypothetical protein
VSTSEYQVFILGIYVGAIIVAPILGFLFAMAILKVGRS